MCLPFKCLAIIVSYNPDENLLFKLIEKTSSQVSEIILIDNASKVSPMQNLPENLKKTINYIQLEENSGLGIAHNIGIKYAEEHSYSHVFILDQDSLPEDNLVSLLYTAEQELVKKGEKVAAVGSNFISHFDDEDTAYIGEKDGRFSLNYCQKDEYIETIHLISSGSLIRLSSIQAIGKMDEELFIDSVDIDWGLRAKAKGYLCYIVCAALMHHQLGDNKVFVKQMNKYIAIHSPLRYYYQYRNAIILYKKPYISWSWIIYHFPRHIVMRFILIAFFLPDKKNNIAKILLGLWHGLINRQGRL